MVHVTSVTNYWLDRLVISGALSLLGLGAFVAIMSDIASNRIGGK